MATFADLTPEEFKELMRDALASSTLGGQNARIGTHSVYGDATDEKARKKMIEDFKKMHTGTDKVVGMLRKQHASYVDVTEQVKKFDEQIENAANETERLIAQEKKKEIVKAAAAANSRARMANFGVLTLKAGEGLNNLAKSAFSSAGGLTKSFLGGASGISTATDMIGAGLDIAGAAGSAAGRGMQEAGGALMQMGKKGRIAGAALEAFGTATAFAAESASKLLKFGVEILGKEIEKTVKAFNTVTSSGAVFGRGMDDLIMYSGQAGLTLDQFSAVVKNNAGVLGESGYTVTDAAKIVAGVTSNLPKIMGKSGLSLQREMQNLGYSFEEQASMVAQVTGDLKKSGGTNGQVAQATVEMGKNMRVVADILGQDAKAKMDEAKKQSEQYAFNAKVREIAKKNNDPGLMKRVQAGLSLMDETQRRAAIQATVLGTVTDVAANIYGQADPAMEFADSLASGGKTIEGMVGGFAKANDQLSSGTDYTMQAISIANVATGSLGDLAKAADSLGQTSFQLTSENLAKAITNINEASSYNQGMQKNIMDIETQMQSALVTIQNMLLSHAGEFTRVLDEMVAHMATMIKEGLGDSKSADAGPGIFQKYVLPATEVAAGVAMGLVGTGAIATGIGAAPGAALDMAAMPVIMHGLSAMGKGYSDGGIAGGSEDGHQELLHGTELIIPLTSDGTTIKQGTEGAKQLSSILGSNADPKSVNNGAITDSSASQFSWPKEFTDAFPSIESSMTNLRAPDVSVSSITDLGDKFSSVAIAPLNGAIDGLAELLTSKLSTASDKNVPSQLNDDMIAALQSLITTAQDQLEKQDEMLRAMNDTKDYTERLYNVMS
jgi:hypothetical protein